MNEIIKKARAAKSAGELIELAKANGKDLTKEQAEMFFKSLSQGGEISDEELSSAVGGCGGSEISWEKSLGFSRIDCRKGDLVGGHLCGEDVLEVRHLRGAHLLQRPFDRIHQLHPPQAA